MLTKVMFDNFNVNTTYFLDWLKFLKKIKAGEMD